MGLIALILDNFGILRATWLRPVATLAVVIGFVAWEAPKVVRAIQGALRRH